MASCVRCGTKGVKGWFSLCGRCEQQVNIERKPDPKKNPPRPIIEPEDDE